MALDQRDDVVAEISPPGRPLEIRSPPVMVRTVESTARVRPPKPLEGLLMTDVHAEGHLRLATVAPEMALADQEAEQEPGRKVALRLARRREVVVGIDMSRHGTRPNSRVFHRQV